MDTTRKWVGRGVITAMGDDGERAREKSRSRSRVTTAKTARIAWPALFV